MKKNVEIRKAERQDVPLLLHLVKTARSLSCAIAPAGISRANSSNIFLVCFIIRFL